MSVSPSLQERASTKLTHVKGLVLLDAAGTLLAPAEPVGAIYARHALAHGAQARSPTTLANWFDARFRAEFPAQPPPAYRAGDAAGNADVDRDWWRALVGRVCDGLPGLDGERFFDAVYAAFAEPECWTLYPEVMDVLVALRSAGLKLAIVSNFDARLQPICDGLGLTEAVDALIWSSALGVSKPSPGIFEAALRYFELPPASVVHVGDSWVHDIDGARGAGIEAILVDRRGQALMPALTSVEDGAMPAMTVSSLAALPALLRQTPTDESARDG